MRRRPLLFLLALPILPLASACSEQSSDVDDPSPAASTVITAAEREWLLSSPEQQAEYCTAYNHSDRSLHSVRYYGFGDEDADEKFVEDFLKLLKQKC